MQSDALSILFSFADCMQTSPSTSLVTDKSNTRHLPNADMVGWRHAAARTARRAVAESVWTLFQPGTRRMSCEIADVEGVGFEMRIKDEGELISRKSAARALPTRTRAI